MNHHRNRILAAVIIVAVQVWLVAGCTPPAPVTAPSSTDQPAAHVTVPVIPAPAGSEAPMVPRGVRGLPDVDGSSPEAVAGRFVQVLCSPDMAVDGTPGDVTARLAVWTVLGDVVVPDVVWAPVSESGGWASAVVVARRQQDVTSSTAVEVSATVTVHPGTPGVEEQQRAVVVLVIFTQPSGAWRVGAWRLITP